MCSGKPEREVSFGRDVHFVRDVCLRQVKRNTSHHFAAKPQNITAAIAVTSLARPGSPAIRACRDSWGVMDGFNFTECVSVRFHQTRQRLISPRVPSGSPANREQRFVGNGRRDFIIGKFTLIK